MEPGGPRASGRGVSGGRKDRMSHERNRSDHPLSLTVLKGFILLMEVLGSNIDRDIKNEADIKKK